ncbi:NepR family anti-sigma factor [Phyllobacterium leguminum]|uniref:Anti-sigma factor NepR domain-containing protein n=1 Tax=Phyllobacterium leguminum TaxID=314237 RepID=A0A318T6T0_9HYPH|nr:NepR family anti-sigma factor [Phyllobacterium leguminum]PYE88727.1 hypothetical protein C7477_10699 [Phyllobacterium leguminum]
MSEKGNLRPRGKQSSGEKHPGARDELGPNSEIGSKLRALYTSIQEETIPDRFLDLLEKLDRVERGQGCESTVPAME